MPDSKWQVQSEVFLRAQTFAVDHSADREVHSLWKRHRTQEETAMAKTTTPSNPSKSSRFFDAFAAQLGIPERVISDGSPALTSPDLQRLIGELRESVNGESLGAAGRDPHCPPLSGGRDGEAQ
jgi:hypothetical protein